ncbi:MAG: SLC13 family permease [Planctomycetes bacterium]|jgi:sodium-dependent dicarboxylate transporter 2/3/5|nr:SLC13 family permease [Planctomycetota bacterium]
MTDATGKTASRTGKVRLAKPRARFDRRRAFFLLLGLGLFAVTYLTPQWPDAVDPKGEHFSLSREGQAALALFFLAATWWIFEVIPIGVTAIAIGVMQAHFLIRKPETAFTNFMDPSVWFIFGSLVIGIVFTKTGLTRRLAYRMLGLVGERTSMIYLGCFVMTAALTLIMAHTAVAATIFPLLMAIYALYEEGGQRTKFGKGLFIGMAYSAGAGSIITLLGAARGAVAIGFFKTFTGVEIGFFELSYYMLPLGAIMVVLVWVMMMALFRPEKREIEGLREKARDLYAKLGPMSGIEKGTLVIVFGAILVLSLRSVMPSNPLIGGIDKSAVILTATVLFFVFRILSVKDLEELPWNIILLFGGAMSIGFCLWETGTAKWLAIHWLSLFQSAPPIIFVLSIAFFVLIMTNFIMNVAAIAISLPVALVIAPYLGVSGHLVMFSALATAGMPFLFLIGAAPNAIAYESKQFSSAEFMRTGVPMTGILMAVLALFVWLIWPLMGMPVTS